MSTFININNNFAIREFTKSQKAYGWTKLTIFETQGHGQKTYAHFLGGTIDPEHLPVAAFRGEGGLVGCVSDLTLGNMLELDLPNAADDGRNIEECSRAFQ